MQLQFIVALLVVLALCEGCAGMNPERLNIGGNDKRNSSNFTNSPNQPETQGKGKGKAKMYSSGSDDGRQSMNQNSFNFGGLNASTNSGTRGGSQTAYTNVSNFGGFNPSTNPANVSNFGGGFNPSTNSGTRNSGGRSHQNFTNSAALKNIVRRLTGGNTSKPAAPADAKVNYFKAKGNTIRGNSQIEDGFAMMGTDTPGIITGYSQDEFNDVVTVLTSGIAEERRIATERLESERERKRKEDHEKKKEWSSAFGLEPPKN